MKNSYEKNADKIYSEINIDEISNLERKGIRNAISDITTLLSTKPKNLNGILWLKQSADKLYKRKLIKKANTLDNLNFRKEILYNIENIKNNDIILKTIKLNLYLDYPEKAVERELDLVYNKRYRFDCEELNIKPRKPNIDELRKKWGSGWYNYSTDIWKDTKELEKRLDTTIKEKIRLNQRINERIKDLRDLTDYGDYAIRRILLTESTRAITLADMQAFIESGAIGIEINAYLDNRTSYICKSLNNKVFYFNEVNNFNVQVSKDRHIDKTVNGIVIGKTAPPFHPNCRTTISPIFEKILESVDRNSNNLNYEEIPDWDIPDFMKNLSNDSLESRALNMFPKNIRNLCKNVKVEFHDKKYSYYNVDNDKIVLNNNADVYDLIHEYGHKIDNTMKLYNDKEFLSIIKSKFSKYSKSDFDLKVGKTGTYYLLKDSNSFVSKYQTRIYKSFGCFIFNKVNVKFAKEYFTEGLKYYYKNPSLLKAKDKELYNFIKRMMIDD